MQTYFYIFQNKFNTSLDNYGHAVHEACDMWLGVFPAPQDVSPSISIINPLRAKFFTGT